MRTERIGPFALRPVVKDYLWGGSRLLRGWGIDADGSERAAEIWALSAHPDGCCTIAGGALDGMTLAEAAAKFPEIVSAGHCPDAPFPIMVKLIDAAKPLSIQVHPDDAYAASHGAGSGKTEMWYIIDHEPDAFIYVGFTHAVSRDEAARRIADGTITDVLRRVHVRRGDCFFIPAGTVHSIGAGILLAEIQQSSNTTYRVFDYGRLGPDGLPRELHISDALNVMNTGIFDRVNIPGAAGERCTPFGSIETLADCPQFRAELLRLSGTLSTHCTGDSFISLLCIEGAAALDGECGSVDIHRGSSVLIPADCAAFSLEGRGKFIVSSCLR